MTTEELGWTRADFFKYAMADDKIRSDINQNIIEITADINQIITRRMYKELGIIKDAGD